MKVFLSCAVCVCLCRDQCSVVEWAAMLAVTTARTWPLTAHQPEPVFMEAEKDGALLEDQACPCWIWDAALLSHAGMLIRWAEQKRGDPSRLPANPSPTTRWGGFSVMESQVIVCSAFTVSAGVEVGARWLSESVYVWEIYCGTVEDVLSDDQLDVLSTFAIAVSSPPPNLPLSEVASLRQHTTRTLFIVEATQGAK